MTLKRLYVGQTARKSFLDNPFHNSDLKRKHQSFNDAATIKTVKYESFVGDESEEAQETLESDSTCSNNYIPDVADLDGYSSGNGEEARYAMEKVEEKSPWVEGQSMFDHKPVENIEYYLTNSEEENRCKVCGKVFLSEAKLRHHMKSHAEKNLLCSQKGCNFVTHRSDSYSLHLQKIHDIRMKRKISCPYCDDVDTKGLERIKHHVATVHNIESQFSCPHCDTKPFYFIAVLDYHIWQCHKEILCRLCSSNHSNGIELMEHMKNEHSTDTDDHASKQEFSISSEYLLLTAASSVGKCHKCGLKITTKEKLIRHLSIHSAQFQCHENGCKYVTNNEETFKRHRRHVKEVEPPPFSCPYCEFFVATEDDHAAILQKHIETVHGYALAPFPCIDCNKTFLVVARLLLHLRAYTRSVCEICHAVIALDEKNTTC